MYFLEVANKTLSSESRLLTFSREDPSSVTNGAATQCKAAERCKEHSQKTSVAKPMTDDRGKYLC